MNALFERIVSENPPPFALIQRNDVLELLIGEVGEYPSLADLPLSIGAEGHDLLALVPFRQIAERGFECVDDNTPLLALKVTEQGTVSVDEARSAIEDVPAELSAEGFDIEDESYAAIVRDVLKNEIGRGLGSNFVIKRTYAARIADYGPRVALSLFTRLLAQETGAYWTFLVHSEYGTLIGASPERHVSLESGVVRMNPISGTYSYPATGPDLDGVLEFLDDPKEIDELYMVVDEELKMMSLVCDGGGQVTGPHLKEMAKLAHTEYFIEGRSSLDPRDLIRGTLFAPTVTGSPLESACQVIRKYEPEGRGYYAGALALFGRDEDGLAALDSAILIRAAQICPEGALRLGVGATLVRHSCPEREVAETAAKAAGFLAALRGCPVDAPPTCPISYARHPRVAAILDSRNDRVSAFWLAPPPTRRRALRELEGLRVLVIDAEDTFTGMLRDELTAMGPKVTVRRFDECPPTEITAFDFTVLGPGPGDPRETAHPKIRHLDDTADLLLRTGRPFLAVCLSHQVLSRRLGLDLMRLPVPHQGLQREIEFFDGPERVGFYNSFAAHAPADGFRAPGVGPVIVSRDPATGEVHGLLGPHFASTQFHAESLLTLEGPQILGGLVLRALTGASQRTEIPA